MSSPAADPYVDSLELARSLLLAPGGLDDSCMARVLDGVMGHAVDAADLYFQVSREESWALEDGIVKEGSASIEEGVGVRAIAGEKTGFAYSDEIHLAALEEAAAAARAIARQSPGRKVQAWRSSPGRQLYLPVDPLATLDDNAKVAWLERVDRETRAMDPRIKQVMASVSAVHEVVLVARADGLLAADVRPLVRFNVSVIAEHDGRREQGYAGAGGRFSLAELVAGDRPVQLAREAVRQALVNLEAVPAPAGTMPVVLAAGWPGILL
ncbi:MAG: protease TldD, partial [Pseudomonadota bacterium]